MDPARIEEKLGRIRPGLRAGAFALSRFLGNAYLSVTALSRPCAVFVLDDDPMPDGRTLRAIETTIYPEASVSIRGRASLAAVAVVELIDPQRLRLFCLLLSDFGDELSNSPDSFGSARQVLDKIDSWREAFQGARPITANEELGLWGELEVLERLGLSDAAVESWHGPAASKFDFAANNISLEVKTSLRHHVHEFSQEQLLAPGSTELYVASLKVREDYASGVSLPEKAERIARRLRGPGLFRRKIAAVGLDPAATLDRRFSLAELWLVEGAGIPTVHDIDPGVASVKFTSDLSGVVPLSPSWTNRVLQTLASRPKPSRSSSGMRIARSLPRTKTRRRRMLSKQRAPPPP